MPESSFFNTETNSIKSIANSSKKGSTANKKLFRGLGAAAFVFLLIAGVVFTFVYIYALKPAFALIARAKNLEQNVTLIQQDLASRDLYSLGLHLDQTESELNALRTARDENIPWAKNFSLTKEYYQDTDYFINTALYMVDAAREAVQLAIPFADAGGFKVSPEDEVKKPTQGSGLQEAFSIWIGIMPQIADDSDVVLAKLAQAGEELSKVNAGKYPEYVSGVPIRDYIRGAQAGLLLLNDAGPDIKRALTIIPPLLGVGTPEKRYMIVMQNDKELRATGGFWTYLATFKLRNGLLSSDFSSYGTYNIDFTLEAIDAYYTFPQVPGAYNRHLKVERLFARDANISPDLPTAVDQFMLFWNLAMPLNKDFKPVDGLFTIDTQVLEELLTITGPVTLNGVTFNAETVTLELEKIASLALREQANRKKILGDLMEAMLVNVFESDKNLWPKLVEKGIDLANRKHIQVVVFNDEAMELLEKYNYAGRIVDPVEGDYVFATSTNLGGGKTNNWFVNKEVEHQLAQEGNRFVRTVKLKFTYGTKAPEYDPFVQIYQDWVRLYVPNGAELISIEGSEDVTGTATERNKTVFDAYITLQPGNTKELVFKYYLPENSVVDNTYRLYVQKQAGIDKEKHTITVNGKSEVFEITNDLKYSASL